MGKVLRALQKSTDRSAVVNQPAVRVVSMAVAEAEQAVTEALTAPPAPAAAPTRPAAAPQPSPAPAKTPVARRITPLRRSAFFSPMILTHHRPQCQVSEQFRQIRTALLRIADGEPVRCMITSSQPREGKTVTATNLAYCFSEIREKRTLLIDADLRRGSVARLLGMTRKRGLAELLAGECSAEEAVWSAGRENFHVLPAGTGKLDQIGELLSSDSANTVMSALAKVYDHIIIDSPPVISVADAGILGRWANMSLMAVRLHKTQRALVEKATQVLESVGAAVTGVIAVDEKAYGKNYYRYDGYAY